jgi:hypothetical protein
VFVAVLILLALTLGACRPAPAPAYRPVPLPPPIMMPVPSDTTCELSPGAVTPAGTLLVALPGPVDPAHAPVPSSDAERLVFPQLYETLVRVDCAGRLVPGLARNWRVDSTGDWRVTLRDGARFWDGAPVTALDVIASWRARSPAWSQISEALSTSEVRLPARMSLAMLAQWSLAVTKRAPDGGWPIGTGAYWTSGPVDTGTLIVRPVTQGPLPLLAFRALSGTDPRDALDQGVQLLVTDDPAVVAYAATHPALIAAPIAWSRRYALVTRSDTSLDSLARQDLARAVHAEARPATSALACLWLGTLKGDQVAVGPVLGPKRLFYGRDDRTAHELAERLVAHGVVGAGVPAVGVSAEQLAATISAGNAWAFVVAWPQLDGCVAPVAGLPRALGLIETRTYVVARRGIPRLLFDADGTVRLAP